LFNASGQYEGSWSTTSTQVPIENCDISLVLFQLPKVPIIKWTVAGLVTFNYDCILPEDVREFLGVEMMELGAPLLGSMDKDNPGTIHFGLKLNVDQIPAGLLEMLDIDPEADIPLQNFELTMDGVGVDEDLDGVMDSFSGTFAFKATALTEGEPLEIDFESTFAVQRVGDI